jgi:signal transduction histidine kinase
MNPADSTVAQQSYWQRILSIISNFGVKPNDNEEMRLQIFISVVTSVIISSAGMIWGIVYIFLGEFYAGLIPLTYTVITVINLVALRSYNIAKFFQFLQLSMILTLPFALMVTLGGLINGSVVMIWAIFAPISALLSGPFRKALYWFLAYIFLVVVSGIIEPYLGFENSLSAGTIRIFFIINIAAVSLTTFLILNYFVRQKDKVIELMRKNRELELSYLQQEVMLRQSEKLATLGKLSAGMAHELNNPAAAALRGTKQLQEIISHSEEVLFGLGQLNLSESQLEIINDFKENIKSRLQKSEDLDPLVRSDREAEIESWLETKNIEKTWDLASMLVSLDLSLDDLRKLADNFSNAAFPAILSALHHVYLTHNLLEEIGEGTGRITELVKSLKSYSHVDKAPIQSIDIHEGINDTLVMLRSQLKSGITVKKDYGKNLPRIQAYGSELNQVWTNVLDNAISAMNGSGEITIKTFKGDKCLVVQIKDTGPGIPGDIQSKVFDPFFTTKPPGEGTGLGLNISHNIIVHKHKGMISVKSDAEGTCFEIKLPLNNNGSESK